MRCFCMPPIKGKKEAEHMVHQGHWGSITRLDTQVGPSAMELVGYQTSHKEIWDIYQVFSCYRDYQVFPVVGMSRERRQSKIFVLLWKIKCIGVDTQPLLPRAWNKKRNSGPDWIDGNLWRSSQDGPPEGIGHLQGTSKWYWEIKSDKQG